MQTLPTDPFTTDTFPSSIGPYRVRELLGRGGSGTVYRGAGRTGADVALKIVHRGSEWGLASLRAEIHALRRVQHDGVVRVLDDGIDGGQPWFAMEYIEGQSLRTLSSTPSTNVTSWHASDARTWTPESIRPALQLVAHLAQALAVVHAAGIVHRDLKPENILVRRDGRPVLVDFGLAVSHFPRAARAVANAAAVAGTLSYMAPEQLRGDDVDARADLFALGCILFEILTGVLPGERPAVASPGHLVPGIPDVLDALVVSLLAPRARNRLAHADDVAVCLASIVGGHNTGPAPAVSLRAWLYHPAFSGRTDTIARLTTGIDLLRIGRGSFMALTGEPGIGKTRIAMEIARRAASEATILTVASEHQAAAPAPLSCWKRLFDAAADRTRARPSSSVALAVARYLPVLSALHEPFASFHRAPVSSERRHPTLDEIFVSIRDLLAAFADERPVLVLVDDIQWADEVTLRVLKMLLASSLRDRAVFFLATCRDDEMSPSSSELLASQHVEQIAVGPLPDDDLRELVADMLGVSEPPEPAVAWVAARAEGNPFLAAEYLHLVVSEVQMVRELDLPKVRVLPPSAAALDALPTPGSVHDIAGRRLSLLDAQSRHVAEVMAVMGGGLHAAVFARLFEGEPARDAFADLQRRQLLVRTPEGGARLLHDRLRVAALRELSMDRRSLLHREAAGLLAAVAPPAHGEIAHHLMEAGSLREAMPYLERAGDQALARAAYETAARHFEDARRIASGLARDGTTFEPMQRVAWQLGAARAHFGRGDLAATEERVREALAMTGIRLPRTPAGWVAMAVKQLVTAVFVRAAPVPDRAIFRELSSAASMLPHRYFYEENMLPVLGSSLLSVNLARRADAGVSVGPSSHLGAMAGLFRLRRLAQKCFDEAHENAVLLEAWRDAAQALLLESFYHAGFGRFVAAQRAAERAAQACAKTSDPWMLENVETTLSHVAFFTGRFSEARERAERVAALARERQNAQHEIWGLYLQARSDIPVGRFASARPLLERARAKLAEKPELISEIACTGMLAEVCLEEGERERAASLALEFVGLVGSRLPSAYPTLVGYTSVATVLCRLVEERRPSSELSRALRLITVALRRFASVFPFATPSAHLYTAHVLRTRGLRRAAHRLYVRGASRAEAWDMPYEQGRLLAGAAGTAPNAKAAAVTGASANEIFRRLGVVPDSLNRRRGEIAS